MIDKARVVAVSTLYDIDSKKSYSNIKLNEYFREYDLEPVDRAFTTEILYGTIRWRLKIDYMIQKFSKIQLENVSLWTLNCIRIAVYQIFFMDKVPEFAAVDQSVEIVKLREKKASTFVNGILRNILRNRNEFDNIEEKDKYRRLALSFSHPKWLVKKFVREYDERFAEELMDKNNTPPGLTIRVNTLKISKEALKARLNAKNIVCRDARTEEGIILENYSIIEKSEEFREGLFTFQDESSMLVARVLDPQIGENIIDMCSAPGGKTTHIAQLMENTGSILAFDIHEHKLKLINDNAERLGIKTIKPGIGDAACFNEKLADSADRVLVDAPCSGLGLIRKKPEIRWNVRQEDINELQKLQIDILHNASKYVKKGGVIVYSTCTIAKEEDEEVIRNFINNNPNFKAQEICGLLPEELREDTCRDGFVKLFPNAHDCDGFFISKFIREW